MKICAHWSIDPPRLHFELPGLLYERPRPSPPRLYFDPLKLLNFDFNADQDLAFHCNADPGPDQASKNNANLCQFGSATLISRRRHKSFQKDKKIKGTVLQMNLVAIAMNFLFLHSDRRKNF
jgi:hypothetical protein